MHVNKITTMQLDQKTETGKKWHAQGGNNKKTDKPCKYVGYRVK